nr:MAG TPA: hypothetical protein [Caudoviricetes sp.]
MTIYIDSDYKCYVSASDGRRAIEVNDFNGKCPEWIESYRFVPEGETWTREDGEVFTNMAAPWKDLSEAYAAQTAYVAAQNAQYEAALTAIENALEVTT